MALTSIIAGNFIPSLTVHSSTKAFLCLPMQEILKAGLNFTIIQNRLLGKQTSDVPTITLLADLH
jgi:hypothetical protein